MWFHSDAAGSAATGGRATRQLQVLTSHPHAHTSQDRFDSYVYVRQHRCDEIGGTATDGDTMMTWSILFSLVICSGRMLQGQAVYTANGPGSYVSLGATISGFESDYGHTLLGGGSVFLDANLYRRIGVEAEARISRLHSDDDLRESTYLVGPKVSALGRTWRPYAKLLVGRGQFNFPFGYAHGSYVLAAPGFGLDWRLLHNRAMIRVVDFEYQDWPKFSYGSIHPYGMSTGLSVYLF